LNLKDRIETNLRNLDKDSTSETLLIGNITYLIREDTDIDIETIQQLAELDDPLIQALCSFLKWKLAPHESFNEIRNFFSSLRSAMNKYSKKYDLSTKLLESFLEKKIQFNLHDELEDDLLGLKAFLDGTLDYEKVFLQERVLRIYVKVLSVLARRNEIRKTSSIVLEINKISIELEKKYRQAQRYDLERLFIGFRIEVNKVLKKDDTRLMELRIAGSYEDEGDSFEKREKGLGLVSYAHAFMSYLDLGEKSRLEQVKAKLKDSGKITKSGLKPVNIGSFKINVNECLQKLLPKISYDEVLKSLTSLSELYPRMYVPTDEEMGIGIQIVPTVVLDAYDNVSAILDWNEDKEECRKFRSFKIFQIEETKHSIVRLELFKYLTGSNLLSKEDIFKLIDCSPINTKLRERLGFGVDKHFERDFKSSSYVLTLQIEPVLISLVRNKTSLIAISHKKNRRGATQETTLGTLLDNGEVRNLLSEDFCNLLELYFTYDLGLSYRNEIAHGLINHDKLSEEYSLTLILFICKMLFMLIK